MAVDYTVYFFNVYDNDGFLCENYVIDNFDELLAMVEKYKKKIGNFTVESYTQTVKI